MRRVRGDESGQVLLLGVALVALALALVLTVASASAVYLDLKRLTALADSAAAAAANAVDSSGYYGTAPAQQSFDLLTDEGVAAAAAADLAAQSALSGLEQVTLVGAEAVDGSTVMVTVRARSRPAFLPWRIVPVEGFVITATGSAQVRTAP